MRQVPHYLIIGNGRVARHFQYYFSLLKLSFSTWNRAQSIEKLQYLLTQVSHIFILINDHAIDLFCQTYCQKIPAYCIHFSGSHHSPYAFGAHPLMTFNEGLYTLVDYQAIPFVMDEDTPAFAELFPGLSNRNIRLNKELKAKYHALCVMSGNFGCLLWHKLFHTFEQEFNLPASIAYPYLRQQMQNLMVDAKTALTGPLVRGDTATLTKNIKALENDPFQKIYLSFIECYQEVKNEYS